MLKKRLAKSHDEFLWDLIVSCHSQRGEKIRMEDVADWIIANDLLPDDSRTTRKRVLTTKLKKAARRHRSKDIQGRTVSTMISAKVERQDEHGQRIIDVVWDYLHTTGNDHALAAFSQRDELIEKQRIAATRNVHSFVDNNPNAKGCESQFLQFAFMLEEPVPMRVETIAETGAMEALSKKKPR